MAAAGQTQWHIKGEEIGSCNCAWGCPCQFNALPTSGHCEAFIGYEIREGSYGDTSLAGTRFAGIYHWPGPIHEGNGTRQAIIDEDATPEQRSAIEALLTGEQGGAYFEIFASVCTNTRETLIAPIEFEIDRERRLASIRIPDVGDTRVEPIKNPVSGEEHRVRIDIPDGFEYHIAEIANTVECRTTAGDPLSLSLDNSYAQLNEFDWSNA